jgi:GAF domain-containing protein
MDSRIPASVRPSPPGPVEKRRLGTVNVIDREPRQITAEQTGMLSTVAALVADHLELRLAAIHAVRAERQLRHEADEGAAAAARLTTQMRNAAAVHADVDHPRTCQLGGASQSCDLPAELKVADPWGDSAWGASSTSKRP